MVCDFRSILCVCVFQGSLLVIVIMIDDSEKRNYCEGAFWTLEFTCEKRSKWCNTWKVEICRKHTQTFLNNFTNKDFSYSRHGYNNIRRNGGPTCYTLHELKNKNKKQNKKAEIVSLNGEKMHHTEHNPKKF